MPRGTAPVIGTVVLVGITVVLATLLGTVALGVSPPSSPPFVAVEGDADAATNRITLVHRGGPALDVRTLRVWITVNGTPLTHQPPVPFFAATGFQAGPTGPFNSASDPTWEPTQATSLRLATTNTPQLEAGVTVTIRIRRGGTLIAEVNAIAR